MVSKIDAIMVVAPADSGLITRLTATPGVQLLSFDRAEAYTRLFPYLNKLILPRGVFSLATNLPSKDVVLIAPTANLITRDSLHPALAYLLLRAATEIHRGAGALDREGEFPSPRDTGFPLSVEAERFYKSGPPLLQSYLPFWLANLIDRMWVVLVSIVAVLIPLSRIVPPLYEFRIRSRIFRWYAQLRQIELRLAEPDAPRTELMADIDSLDDKVQGLPVPLSHADELYTLRSHIQLVRRRLLALATEPKTS